MAAVNSFCVLQLELISTGQHYAGVFLKRSLAVLALRKKGLKILFRFQSLFHWYIEKINLVNGWKGERQGEGVYQKVLQKSMKYSNTPRSWKC